MTFAMYVLICGTLLIPNYIVELSLNKKLHVSKNDYIYSPLILSISFSATDGKNATYKFYKFCCDPIVMAQTSRTKLEISTYHVLIALGKEADFLYSTVDTYIDDVKKDNRQHLVDIWNEMKRDKEKHLLLREALEKVAKEHKLNR